MRRALFWLVGIAVVLIAIAAVLIRVPALQDRVIERVIATMVRASADDLLREDALRVLLCGTSSPLPHPDRAKSCTAVFASGRFWVVDTGPGSWNRLALWRIPAGRVGAILLTHFHSDHIAELGEFNLQTWVGGRPGPLRVFGPPGVGRVVAGFEEAYALDTRYRIEHHGVDLLPEAASRMQAIPIAILGALPGPITALGAAPGPVVVHDEGGLRITAFAVDHRPVAPALGYRFDYRGRSAVVTGDTVKLANVIEAARDADVLVHEAQANHLVATIGGAAAQAGRDRIAKIMGDIPDYHTTPVEAAEVANEAGVDLVVFSHLTPPPPNRFVERVFVRGVADVRPEGWMLGSDGLLIELPADSDAIDVRSLD
jgi:ribonuclease Z